MATYLESANCLRMGPFIDLPASRSGRGNAALSSRRTAPRRSPAAHPPLMDPVGVPGIGNGCTPAPSPREKYAEGSHFGEGARAHPAPPLRRSALGSHLLQCSPGNLSVPACHACSLPCQSQHAHLARGRRCEPIGAEALSHAARDFWGLSQKDKPLAQPIKQLWSSGLG